MQIDAYWAELQALLTGIIVELPGKSLTDKTGLLANIVGIAGFVLSIGIVVVRFVTQRWRTRIGSGRPSSRLSRIALSINWLQESWRDWLMQAGWHHSSAMPPRIN